MTPAGFDPRADSPFDRLQAAVQRRATAHVPELRLTQDEIIAAFDAMPPDVAFKLANRLASYANRRAQAAACKDV